MVKVFKVLEAADGRETAELQVKRIKEDVRKKRKHVWGYVNHEPPRKGKDKA
jgi:hypothetical protein